MLVQLKIQAATGIWQGLTHYSCVVVIWQHPLAQSHQEPESLFLIAVQQQHRGDNVHGLGASTANTKEQGKDMEVFMKALLLQTR